MVTGLKDHVVAVSSVSATVTLVTVFIMLPLCSLYLNQEKYNLGEETVVKIKSECYYLLICKVHIFYNRNNNLESDIITAFIFADVQENGYG